MSKRSHGSSTSYDDERAYADRDPGRHQRRDRDYGSAADSYYRDPSEAGPVRRDDPRRRDDWRSSTGPRGYREHGGRDYREPYRQQQPYEHGRRPHQSPQRDGWSRSPRRAQDRGDQWDGELEEGEILPRGSDRRSSPSRQGAVATAPVGDSPSRSQAQESSSAMEVSLVDDVAEEPDPEVLLAERRKKRLAILAKYANSNVDSSSSTPAATPPAEPDTPRTVAVERETKRLRLDTPTLAELAGGSGGSTRNGTPQLGGVDSPNDLEPSGTFELEKGEEEMKAEAEQHAQLAASGSTEEEDISAADYNPDLDRMNDDRRQAEKHHVPEVTVDAAEESEYEEVEVEDDDDEDDMFSIGVDDKPKEKKVVRRKKVKAGDGEKKEGVFVPVIVRAPTASGLVDNHDDAEGYYVTILGELLDNGRYHVHANLGKGMFSSVVRAKDTVDGGEVAIKVVRSQESMYKAGQKEAALLRKLGEADPTGKKHVIRMLRTFDHRGHLCIVFESLSMNLREVVKRFGKDVGINLRAVRAYATQMFLALSLFRKCDVIHADIKPDNILVNDSKSVLRVCDLGSAADVSAGDITPYLVSRFYRAPEIILGLPYDFALDVWSIGCTIFELYTGKILFPGRTNNHMLLLMMELKGKFPHKLIKKGQFGAQHFSVDENMQFLYTDKTDAVKSLTIANKATNDLKARLMPPSLTKKMKEDELKLLTSFVDFIDRTLQLDPSKRMTPKEALAHPFIRSAL